jgi:DNA-binding response OmpR family regulator
MLPDSDGLDICKGIRMNSELAHIPVIFLTARAAETDRIVGLELGANDYIVKPFLNREMFESRSRQHYDRLLPADTATRGPCEELESAA